MLNMFNLFKKKENTHNWELCFSNLSKDHKQTQETYQCIDCKEVKDEFKPIIKPREAQIE